MQNPNPSPSPSPNPDPNPNPEQAASRVARRESEQALLREHGLEQALQRLQVRSLVITPSRPWSGPCRGRRPRPTVTPITYNT